MSEKVDQALQAVLDLTPPERAELLDALHAATGDDPANGPFDDEWLAEIERRSDELDRGEVKTVSWEDVKRRALERWAGRD